MVCHFTFDKLSTFMCVTFICISMTLPQSNVLLEWSHIASNKWKASEDCPLFLFSCSHLLFTSTQLSNLLAAGGYSHLPPPPSQLQAPPAPWRQEVTHPPLLHHVCSQAAPPLLRHGGLSPGYSKSGWPPWALHFGGFWRAGQSICGPSCGACLVLATLPHATEEV